MRKALPLFVSLISIAIFSYSQPGMLDSSFGINGLSSVAGFGYIQASTLQGDGKIVVVGRETSKPIVIIARYNVDGSTDETFGENGIVYTDLKNSHQFNAANFEDVLLQPDGKIIAGGYFWQYNSANVSAGIARINVDGCRDTSFGLYGFAGGAMNQFVNTLALQADGKIVVGGVVIFSFFTIWA